MKKLIAKFSATSFLTASLIGLSSLSTPAAAITQTSGCIGGDFGADCSLAELHAGGWIKIDNSLFDGWFVSFGTGSASTIKVTSVGEGSVNPGLLFEGPGVNDGGNYDFEMNYNASTVDLSNSLENWFVDIDLGQVSGNAGGFAAMEVIDNNNLNEIATPEPTVDQNGTTKSDVFIDEVSLLQVATNTIKVTTNVMLFSDIGESIQQFALTERFGEVVATQAPNPNAPVPEPSTVLLLGTGLVGLAIGAKRRKDAAA